MNKQRDTMRSYTELAGDYDAVRFSDANGQFLFETDQRIVTEMLALSNAAKAIDVPVGTGRVLSYLRGQKIHVVGVDCTSEMLEKAALVADPNYHSLVEADAAALPFQDSEFDCLISLRFFHLFKKDERAVFAREFSRVVRPGGFLIVSFTNGWYAGGVNWLRKVCGRKTVYFEYPREVKKLFPNCCVQAMFGNYLPKQRLFDKVPIVGAALRRLTSMAPLNRFCWERFYLLHKKAG